MILARPSQIYSAQTQKFKLPFAGHVDFLPTATSLTQRIINKTTAVDVSLL